MTSYVGGVSGPTNPTAWNTKALGQVAGKQAFGCRYQGNSSGAD